MVSDDEFRQACKRKMDTILSFAGTKEIWIFGVGEGGRILLDELKQRSIHVRGFIDRKAELLKTFCNLPVMKLENIDWESIVKKQVKPAFVDLNLKALRCGMDAVNL